MIIAPVKKKPKIVKPSKKLLLGYESVIYKPSEMSKMFKIVDEKERIFVSRLIHMSHISRNRCLYMEEDILHGLKNSKYVQECIQQGNWLGEWNHPSRGVDLARFCTIDEDRVSHRILKYWVDEVGSDRFLVGLIQCVGPYGDQLWDYMQKGINRAFSLRIYTPNYEKCQDENGPYIKKLRPLQVVTIDNVGTPGYEKCRMADPEMFAASNPYWLTNGKPEDLSSGKESYLNISQNWLCNNPLESQEQLEDIGSESLLEDVSTALSCIIKPKVIKKRKSISIPMYINTKISHDILNHL